jgi:DNA polymerase II small subunit
MVTSNITTKKGNIMVQLEDETGSAKLIFINGTSQRARELFAEARSIVNDEVIAVRGRISGPFVIANEILWPDVPIKEPKDVDEDIAIAFMSDLHVGSKQFMERNTLKMLDWLNGNVDSKSKELAGKVKYVIINGDIVDGIGVYPNQEKDLAIPDMYGQYKLAFDFIGQIPDYISVFVLPGNHDVVQRAEPQPRLPKDVVGEFSSNVHLLGNPSFLNLHEIKVLAYHGCGLDSTINAIPNSSYASPEKAMIELLKRRHLSPIYGGNVIVPSREDNMTIDRIPDILHMGHVHKNGIANYHGVYAVNSGTWQAKTDYQVKLGHTPSPCLLPVYELKAHRLTTVDFN